MAGLDEIRDSSRAAIHAKFALPAIISIEGVAVGAAGVRLYNTESRSFGDLDREGYAFSLEGKNVLVFDVQEWVPDDTQDVDFGRGRVYHIDNVIDDLKRVRYARCVASEVKPQP